MNKVVPAASRVASIRQRLLDRARAKGEDFQLVLDRFAVERLLYRLSISPYRDQFWLKGAMLFAVWFDTPHRPTRDADFLGFGSADPGHIADILRELCAIGLDDGLVFDLDSLSIEETREAANYDGLRIRVTATLGSARCHVQWDVGFGDAVTPAATEVDYPVLLNDMPAPRLRAYPRETVFAEKLEAIATLGIANSRMKDYFDLLALIREGAMDETVLRAAIRATFERRDTRLLKDVPFGLTDEFSLDRQKQAQWQAFLRRNRLDGVSLQDATSEIRAFVRPLLP